MRVSFERSNLLTIASATLVPAAAHACDETSISGRCHQDEFSSAIWQLFRRLMATLAKLEIQPIYSEVPSTCRPIYISVVNAKTRDRGLLEVRLWKSGLGKEVYHRQLDTKHHSRQASHGPQHRQSSTQSLRSSEGTGGGYVPIHANCLYTSGP